MAFDRNRDRYSEGEEGGKFRRKTFSRRRACRFCTDKEVKVDFKNGKLLSNFISERGRIIPRRISGNCALHQRDLTIAVKRARSMALLPFTTTVR